MKRINWKLMKKLVSPTALIILFTMSFSTFTQSSNIVESETTQLDTSKLPRFLPSLPDSPIYIGSQFEFETYSSTGDGSLNTPYIIENYGINTTGIETGIRVSSTSYYFEIRNCTMYGGYGGISLSNVASNRAKIYNNTIMSTDVGMRLDNCTSQLIESNYIFDCVSAGMDIYSNNVTIFNNTIEDGGYYGIRARDENTIYIKENKIFDSDGGISVENITSVEIEKNIVINNMYTGVFVSKVNNSLISSNILEGNQRGLQLSLSNGSLVTGNNCSNNAEYGLGTMQSENINFTHNRLEGDGFYIHDSNYTRLLSFNIDKTTNFVNGKPVIFEKNSDSVTISSDTDQIILVNCTSISIHDITMSNVYQPIISFNCSNIVINNVDILDCYYGIAMYNSSNILLNECTLAGNIGGFGVTYCKNLVITNNIISLNYNGMTFDTSIDCLITMNKFQSCTLFAIIMVYCESFVIYHNDFINNGDGTFPQAYDFAGTSNFWYNASIQEGNYWSDWSGTGGYVIYTGNGAVMDLYPLGTPVIPEFSQKISIIAIIGLITLLSLVFVASKRR